MNVVLYSGGVGSYMAAKRIAKSHDTHDLILLFTDTKSEDDSTYRFLRSSAKDVGGELIEIADGRDVWEVFFSERMMGNSRIDPCSRLLKRKPARDWVNEHCDPDQDTIALGIDWTEHHRFERMKRYWEPFAVAAPMTEAPYMLKTEMLAYAESRGLELPELYGKGFSHSNCGGACVKAGKAQWRHLLGTNPELFMRQEANEQRFREFVGKPVSILKESRDGVNVPVTLKELRERWEAGDVDQGSLEEWGGCGCFSDTSAPGSEVA